MKTWHSLQTSVENMRFQRALSLVRYNWPLYAVSCSSTLLGFAVSSIPSISESTRIIAFVVACVAAWYTIASFFAFHAMFDRSHFLSGNWLKDCVKTPPRRCLQLSVSLEETTLPIDRVFPDAKCANVDLFDQAVMTEPAVNRARASRNNDSARIARPDAIPLGDADFDFTVITLAAHEVRERKVRESLFHELSRVTKPEGRIIVVEHLRNLAAFLAFGPAFFHFFPRTEWIRLAEAAGLGHELEFPITPFIHVFVFSREKPVLPANSRSAR